LGRIGAMRASRSFAASKRSATTAP
jgi:hypothetical protein